MPSKDDDDNNNNNTNSDHEVNRGLLVVAMPLPMQTRMMKSLMDLTLTLNVVDSPEQSDSPSTNHLSLHIHQNNK